MKKPVVIIFGIIIFLFLALSVYLSYLFYFSHVLWSFNNQYPQIPDVSCNVDEDCRLSVYPEWNKCELCGTCETFDINDTRVIAINNDWEPHCPFPKPSVSCPACIGGIRNYDGDLRRISDPPNVRCIENKCRKVLN